MTIMTTISMTEFRGSVTILLHMLTNIIGMLVRNSLKICLLVGGAVDIVTTIGAPSERGDNIFPASGAAADEPTVVDSGVVAIAVACATVVPAATMGAAVVTTVEEAVGKAVGAPVIAGVLSTS